ncbi:hypothetical protein EFK07_25855 [Pseudomonas putida]|uniref:Uncharacterized protein n=1 Tax=Pseudomonas putida TaxID=303 RepID=A0A3M8SJZ2_PSEPU|nr:hypothetical protein EFK07_25855 [Pseudomonas putida]UPK88669.1 hypothetical protein E5221_28570 [Pseudomonas sp. A2]
MPASSRVNPLPQVLRRLEDTAVPVGAGSPAKRPARLSPDSGQCVFLTADCLAPPHSPELSAKLI